MAEAPMNPDSNTDTSEVVFLTGAGVSIPVGIPAMKEMYTAFLNRAKSMITEEEKKSCYFLTQKLGVSEDLEEFLLALNNICDFGSSCLAPFVERTISERKGTTRLRYYQQRLNGRIRNANVTRDRILNFMSETCFRFNRQKACNIFGNFVDAISQKGYPVYSTNYDPAFEHVATERDIDIEDNFSKQGQRRLWNPGIHFPLGNALTLIQLHGAVTWYADKDGVIEKIPSHTAINLAGKDVSRLVIFPTRFKDIYDQHFFALYCHFLSALSYARVLFIIGHSLRDEYIKAAIIERHRKGKFQIIIVDPILPEELPRELKPARLGTTGDVTHVPFVFEEFADELANLILNSSPSDLARECAKIVHQRNSRSNKIIIRGNIGNLKPGDTKKFKAIVDAYLLPREKPAYVRVWLSSEYTTPDGKKQKGVSSTFLESSKIEVGSDLTGRVQDNIPIQIKVPNYPEWVEHTSKATLHVALMQKSVTKPNQAKDQTIFASDTRELTYGP